MRNTKVLWSVIVILLMVLVGIFAKFMVLGNTTAGTVEDARTVVALNAQERSATLFEMRSMLEATQQVVVGLAENNMQQVAEAATAVGMQATSTMDMRLMMKLPMPFKKMGMATHQAFDEIASMAKAGEPALNIQRKLADTMNNCIACHSSYQIPSFQAPR